MTHVLDGVKLDFKDVMFVPKRSTLGSRKDVNLQRNFKFGMNAIPIMAANMDSVGTIEMANALGSQGLITVLHKFYPVRDLLIAFKNREAFVSDHVFISVGITDDDLQKLDYLRFHGKFHNICIDVANGYSERFINTVKRIRETNRDARIMVGNVCTPDVTQQLILAGADIVKVGIGPGSACETRIKTGVGYPQLSAIMECAEAAHGLGGYVCGDGGCSVPGDVAKAFGGGADFVMLGGMFAGHYEAIEDKENLKYEKVFRNIEDINERYNPIHSEMVPVPNQEIEYYGMSSKEAMDKHYGGVAVHRTAEGKVVKIKYKGYVEDTVNDLLGGLRSACTYVGARTLKDLPKCTTFARVA